MRQSTSRPSASSAGSIVVGFRFVVVLLMFFAVSSSIAAAQILYGSINVLNHPNVANPGGDISNAGTFGFITQTTGTGERNLGFGLRIAF